MHYAIAAGEPGTQGKPYKFFKFRTENATQKCTKSDEFSIVFDSPEQLQEVCPNEDIVGILTAMGVEVNSTYTYTPTACAKALFRLVEQNAVSWGHDEPDPTPTEEPAMAEAVKKPAKKSAAKKPKSEKKAKAAKAPKEKKPNLQAKARGSVPKTGKIKKLAPNPARVGTNRHLNIEAILGSKTVEEALNNLRNLQPQGGMVDIRFALANKLIEVIGGE